MAKTQKSKASQKSAEPEMSVVLQQLYISQVTRGNQTIQTWINNVKSAESIRNPNRKALLNTFLDISIDSHVEAMKAKRIRAVKTTPFDWQGLTSEAHVENLKAPWFNELLGYPSERIFWGPTVVESLFGPDGLISDVVMIPRQNLKPEKGLISFDGSSDSGIFYRQPPNNNYLLEIGKPNELGLFANIAPLVLLKRGNLADYARFNEMFGMPLRWYEYDPLDPTSRDNVKKSAEEMGSAAYVIVPKGTTVNFVESAKQATAYTYKEFHAIMDDAITISILGQLLTTAGKDGGSYALGDVHQSVERAINLEDRLATEYILNYPFKNNILIPHGYPMEGVVGRFKLTEELGKEAKAKIWIDLATRAGLPIAEEDFYNEFGIPFPDSRPVVVPPASPGPAPVAEEEGEEEGKPKKKPQPGGAGAKKRSARLSHQVAELYVGQCKHRHQFKPLQLSYNIDLKEIIEDVIKRLHNGTLKPGDVDRDLWELVAKELFGAVETGYGSMLAAATGDTSMLRALRSNVYVFSGFKNYQMLKEASSLLVDERGAVKAFSKFRNDILKLNNQYNVDFLSAEYNHAIGTARMAAKWEKFQKDKGILPLLQYLTAGDGRVRQQHRLYDKLTAPVDHPVWDEILPINDWGCRCNARQLADGVQSELRLSGDVWLNKVNDKWIELPRPKEMFRFNAGKHRVIFPKSHPYYQVAAEHQDEAENNFGLTIPE